MKILKIILKVFIYSVLVMALIIGSIAIYMKYYGDEHMRKALSELMGVQVNFRSTAINLEQRALNFKGFSIASEISFDKNIFDADTVTVILAKGKKVVFDRVYIRGAKLNIIRDKKGALNLAPKAMRKARLEGPPFGFGGVAYAEEASPPSKNGLYDLLKSVRNIKIEDSIITYEDNFKMAEPYKLWFDRLFMELSSSETNSGYISSTLTLNIHVPQKRYGEGGLGLQASLAVYPDKTNMELSAETRNIDLMVFLPYFQRNTPFYFRSGRFSSRTDLKLHEGTIDSLTTMYFSDLYLVINTHDENAQFLHVSINRLAPYLRSGENLIFDFVTKGSAANPQFGIGPRVKYAIGMVMMEEVGRVIQQMQRP